MTTTVAAVQMISGPDMQRNLDVAEQLLADAAACGARLAVLPEMFAQFGTPAAAQRKLGAGERAASGPVRRFLAAQARRHGIWIVGGSVPTVSLPDSDEVLPDRTRAACFVYNAQGEEVARYDKIHLFDVEVGDKQGRYAESDTFAPGDRVVTLDTPFGRLGLAVCYDLRFPELFRVMFQRGVDMIALPSAFTHKTGEAHWLALLRARAIENCCYMIGANQGGAHNEKRETFGHSAIIDGWGTTLAAMQKGVGVICAGIDLAELERLRRQMPVRQHQRFLIDD